MHIWCNADVEKRERLISFSVNSEKLHLDYLYVLDQWSDTI